MNYGPGSYDDDEDSRVEQVCVQCGQRFLQHWPYTDDRCSACGGKQDDK